MKLTSKELLTLISAMSELISVTSNQIATCPDEAEYAEALDEIEADLKGYQKLNHRLGVAYEKAMNKQNQARISAAILNEIK
jgi:hypothetical protein